MIVERSSGDPGWTIRYVNQAFTRILGYTSKEAVGANPLMLCGPESDLEALQQRLGDALAGNTALFELLHYRKGGVPIWLEASIFPLRNRDGAVTHSVWFGRDIGERKLAESALVRAKVAEESNAELRKEIADRKRAEARLVHAAFHDPLTGLPNRELFVDRVKSALARSSLHPGKRAAVLSLDCDRFKLVNDTLGHLAGDLLLIAVARRLEACLRPGDTLARPGGDEFSILLEDIHDEAAAVCVAKSILEALSAPFSLGDHELYETASIGIALGSPEGPTPENLLRDADIAMHRAKVLGKNRYELFETKLREQSSRLLLLELELRRALDRAQLSLAYQPIVSLADGNLTGFEGLLRWQHPELGAIPPLEFIPVAEETGLIIPLGEWVLHAACAQTRLWQQASPAHATLSVNVNVSVQQLLQERFTDRVRDTLRETGLRAEDLHLEITESTLMTEPDRIAAVLRELHALGVKLQVDDFGTGYSSLAYLHRFPIDTLKIDRTFVSGRGEAGIANPEIVQAVVVLASRLGIDVIAEGVETAEQESQLGAYRCGSAQGYLFAKPLDAHAAARYLSAHAMHEAARPVRKKRAS